MRVLILGSAGFLGRHFTQHHLEAGDQVVGVDNLSNPHSFFLDGHTKVFADARDFIAAEKIGTYDLVYHMAGEIGGRTVIEGDPMVNAQSLEIDSKFFRWVSGLDKKPLVVYPSSSAVYPVNLQHETWHQPLAEWFVSPSEPEGNMGWPDEMYGLTKLAGEFLAMKAAQYGVSTLCIRPFSGYGEGQSEEYPTTSIARRVISREDPLVVWGTGEQTRDFIHVSDLVAITVARLNAGVEGYQVMNIGSGIPTSFNDLARMAANIEGYEPEIKNLPDRPSGVFWRVANITEMKKYGEPKVYLHEGLKRVMDYERERMK